MKYILHTLAIMLLLSCASCKPDVNTLLVCLVDIDTPRADCNKGDVHTTPLFPSEMQDHVSFDEVALNLFMSRKQECIEHKPLPSHYHTLTEMNLCVVEPSKPPLFPMPTCINELVHGNFTVDRVSFGKMKNYLEYCGER